MYLLYPDARGDYFEHEDGLLEFYFERLMDRLEGREGSYSMVILRMQYQLAQLHFLGHMLSGGWVASQPSDAIMIEKANAVMAKWDAGGLSW